jgi:hypothetical protein
VSSEEVLEYGEVGHGGVHHLREAVVGELGGDEVPTPELVVAQSATLVHFLLDVPNGPVNGEGHAVPRDDGVVDHVRVSELFVHHVERLDELRESSSSPIFNFRMWVWVGGWGEEKENSWSKKLATAVIREKKRVRT